MRREPAGELIGWRVFTVDFFAHACKKRIHFDEEILWRQTTERGVPQPLVTHGTDAALYLLCIGDAAESCGDHIAVFECRNECRTLRGIVAKPMKEFGETPFRRIDAAAPIDCGELLAARGCGDFRGFGFGAVI